MKCVEGCTCRRHNPRRGISKEESRLFKNSYMRDYRQRPEYKRSPATPEQNLKWSRVSRYGITPEDWDLMYKQQQGCCYLCERPFTDRTPHVDHDHSCCPAFPTCGKCNRGLACAHCNTGIGNFNDDPYLMIKVAENLKKKLRGGIV